MIGGNLPANFPAGPMVLVFFGGWMNLLELLSDGIFR